MNVGFALVLFFMTVLYPFLIFGLLPFFLMHYLSRRAYKLGFQDAFFTCFESVMSRNEAFPTYQFLRLSCTTVEAYFLAKKEFKTTHTSGNR